MNKSLLLGAVMALGMAATTSGASTLEEVKARGKLSCGTSTGVAGFSLPDANNVYQGFDVAVCRAVAAAVLEIQWLLSLYLRLVKLVLQRLLLEKLICCQEQQHGLFHET